MKRLVIIALVALIAVIWGSSAYAGGSEARAQIANELTAKYKAMGGNVLFEPKGKDKNILRITQKNIVQQPRLTDGQVVTVLGMYLGDGAQAKLKKAGFKRGEFVDGRGRKYPFAL